MGEHRRIAPLIGFFWGMIVLMRVQKLLSLELSFFKELPATVYLSRRIKAKEFALGNGIHLNASVSSLKACPASSLSTLATASSAKITPRWT
jgi:hypothetical protein